MIKELTLSPEELYYLGTILQAKYIDYAYVAAMEDIKQNYSLFELETKASLVSSGVLLEDFSGNVEVNSDVLSLIKPVFFGEVETSVDICQIDEKSKVIISKYHFFEGAITLVTAQEKKLVLKMVDQITIKDMITRIVPESYSCFESKIIDALDNKSITRFIAVKSIYIGQTAIVKTYIEANGILYQEREEQIESVTKDTFVSDVYEIVKGE